MSHRAVPSSEPDRQSDVEGLLGALRAATPARVGLGRAGAGLPTAAMLEFQLAHAKARDAVWAELDTEALRAALPGPSLVIASAAPDRRTFLLDPERGRRLDPHGAPLPQTRADLAILIADGLCAAAVQAQAPLLLRALLPRLEGWRMAPLVVARQGRVALGDAVGDALGARAVLVLLGERPGLSAADSLGAYLTWDPRPGRRDHERNCVSNIREPGGLSPPQAAEKLAWLLHEARRLGFTGVDLKDRQDAAPLMPPASPQIAPPTPHGGD